MTRYRGLAAVLVGVGMLGVIGTSAGDISGTGNRNEAQRFGLLSFLFKDAPVDDAQAVVLTVSGLELLDNAGKVRQAYTIDPPRTLDVLQLQGGLSETLLDGVEAPVGRYQQLRLLVETPPADCQNLAPPFAAYVDVAGTHYPLVLPAGDQSGLTFRGDVDVRVDEQHAYMIDLDLRQAITRRGHSGCYTLRPALRVAAVAASGAVAGRIDADWLNADHCDTGHSPGDGAAVYAFAGHAVQPSDIGPGNNNPLATANLSGPDEVGDFSYRLDYLPAGAYTLALTCQAGRDDVEQKDRLVFDASASVDIDAQQLTPLDFSLP